MEIRYAQSGDVSLAYALEGESGLPLIFVPVAALAGAGELLTIETVQDLVAGSGFSFRDAGTPELKGLGPRRLLAVQ